MEQPAKTSANDKEYFQRFGLQFRFQHIVLFLSTTVLIFTVIPLWFLGKSQHIWWNKDTFEMIGGIGKISSIHRGSALVLILLSVYHLLYTILSKTGRREFINLLPKFKDVADVTKNSLYFLGLCKERPRFDRYSYMEKFDYWAVYWGCVIMIVTGTAIWFPHECSKYMPWLTYDLAAEIHAGEAILAALALFVWHFYNVHFNPSKFPGSLMWFHGRISEEEIIEEHPLEYEKLTRKTPEIDK